METVKQMDLNYSNMIRINDDWFNKINMLVIPLN